MTDHIQIVIGSILGDGSLSPLTKRMQTSRLDVSQHIDKLPYLKWLHQTLSEKFNLNPIREKKGFEQMFRFSSKSNELLGTLRSKFYSNHNGKKIIPPNIGELLTNPIALAVWYMDDGTLDKRQKYHFNSLFATYCFSTKECDLLTKTLKNNFGLNATVNQTTMRGKKYPRIYIKSESMNDFIDIIKPHIHPVFNYKMGT